MGCPPTFAQFKQDRELGRFAALAQSDDEESVMCSDSEDEEAPYAYTASSERAEGRPVHETEASRNPPVNPPAQVAAGAEPSTGILSGDRQDADMHLLSSSYPISGCPANEGSEVDADMGSDSSSVLSGYVGSSAPSCTPSPAPTPGSEFPFSLASEPNTQESVPSPSPATTGTTTSGVAGHDAELLPEQGDDSQSTMSQDGFVMGPTTPAPGMPQQLPVFLLPFRGALTKVPANGQCAYAALYTSTTATVETKLTFTSGVVRGANVVKRSVYTLMLTNIANDVACKVLDPPRELQRLYPSHTAPQTSSTGSGRPNPPWW
ncbi:hypothetical protein PF005_g12299 [Phytophthora fragariae]|uniref:Uncharacterized protein n=1 Tax=Phytophthora fragariae TaxID=53985 RepID=A0A6A3UCB3_9STRA|nr:hypothetical protein PF003_g2277 [Phytophthora fragariae]KAE8942181.1 hypothetical protein PF009_g8050 [Phytophthora fragariae]KAE9108125.1 hypothetical protein PF007_g12776 [Phytophthora fragariae]KAE9144603.1 hypothetical protein PF006_g10479 [Phytophthora fragariae]KAE9208205.1 hypothetical protein PF005_g12299 [Phytophthora fragariae]